MTPSLRKTIFYALAITFGILSAVSDVEGLHTFASFISDVFIRAFKCISLPLILLSLIVVLSREDVGHSMKRVFRRTLFYTITTTILATCVTCLLYLAIQPENLSVFDTPPISMPKGSYVSHLSTLMPSNILSPFLDHHVMGVLLMGLVMGCAIRFIPSEEGHHTIVQFFKGLHGLFLVVTRWIVAVIPLALFGFIETTLVQLKQGMHFAGMIKYLAVVVLANVVQGFVILPLWLKSNGIAPFKAMHGMLPALSLAFFSKSSAGALPVTIETAEKNLNINPKISRFVLPLCTTINMNGCAAFIFATVMYLMQNHGLAITFPTMILWIFVATIAAIGNAGIPMGCFFLSASLLSSMDVPIVLLGMILPFYSVIDMVETSLNVWSDACITKVVDQLE